ncbi:MAG: hypothetical protein EHM15_07315, partial [Desulfobacteraceae bacterium]
TGNLQDTLAVPSLGGIRVSIVDAANPVVFVPASAIGLSGAEIEEFDTPAVRATLEAIRSHASVVMGLAATPEEARRTQAVPKIAVVSPPASYRATDGALVEAAGIDFTARIMSMGALHRSYAVTGGICTVGAAMLAGTVVHAMLRPEAAGKPMLTIGHPGGTIDIGAVIDGTGTAAVYREAVVGRTARRLMQGVVLVPKT